MPNIAALLAHACYLIERMGDPACSDTRRELSVRWAQQTRAILREVADA